MIQEVKEHNDEGNPYNARKPWIDYEEKPRGIAGANDGLAYKVERKTVVSSLRGEPPVTQETPEPETPVYSQVDYKKRYDDLKKHYDSKLNEFRQKETEYEKKLLETVPKFKPPKTPDELQNFKKSNPELFDVVQTVAHEMAKAELDRLEKQVNSLTIKELQLARQNAEAVISRQHPDFVDIRESDAFHDWAKTQPQQIQDWIYKNTTDPTLVIKALDLYKLEAGVSKEPPITGTTRQATPDASMAVMSRPDATGPQSTSQKIWTTSEIDALSIMEYEKYRDEIDKAFLEGRIRQDSRSRR